MIDTLTSLLSSLVKVGATVSLGEGSRLRLSAPPGAVSAEMREAVIVHRDAIVEHLRRGTYPRELDSTTVACLEYGATREAGVFCFHGFQGTVGVYRPVASILSAAADVFGVQAVGVDLNREGLPSIGAMADYYAMQLALLPCVRIWFVGWCIGAPLAIETARRLRQRGRVVECVFCADPWLGQLSTADDRWREFLEIYLSERTTHEALAESRSLSSTAKLAWLAKERNALRPDIGIERDLATLSRRLAFWETMDSALREYRYQPHQEMVRLLLSAPYARDHLAEMNDAPRQILDQPLLDNYGFACLGRAILPWLI